MQVRPRLKQLIIRNFRGIGNRPVTIELDKIVVLVGPNNAGKSSILRAYEVAMSEGSNEAILVQDDFPGGIITNSDSLPEIELHTVVHDNAPGPRWISVDAVTQEKTVMERWTWASPGAPKRQGYDVDKKQWAEDGVPWGAPNVANSYRPKPHRVDAFSDPKVQADAIAKLLADVIKERVKYLQEQSEEESQYKQLLRTITTLRQQVIDESNTHIEKIEVQVSELLSEVFPGYVVKFDPRAEEDVENDLSLFNKLNNAQLKMGYGNGGHLSTLDRQGSGARRTLLWSALRMIAETNLAKPTKKGAKKELIETVRPHVLLLDEPELCLHPNAVREACRVLYDLPNSGNWQVMVTTHSPAFIDVSRDNTTIIKVEQLDDGNIAGTTVFRPERAKLDDEDRALLKLLNIFDPYIAEFFFGGRCIIVEGDTEYTALKHIIATKPELYKDVHIIRARGKATIVSLIKILNHFGSSYSVLHDSDTLTTIRNGKKIKNPAWVHNEKIFNVVANRPETSKVRLLASLGNFEKAYFGEEVKNEKPYNAIMNLQQDSAAYKKVEELLKALLDHSIDPPHGALQWTSIAQLEEFVYVFSGKDMVAGADEKMQDETASS